MDFAEMLSDDPEGTIQQIKKQKKVFKVEKQDALKQYRVEEHDVFDSTKRPNKLIKQYRGEGKTGPIYETVLQPVTRIGIPYQKVIVERLVGLMLGNDIKLVPQYFEEGDNQPNKLFNKVRQIWFDTKLNFVNRDILRRLLSEMEVAEYWYVVKDEDKFARSEYKYKVKVLSSELGDMLYPYFDVSGDLECLVREYVTEEEEKKTRYDVFTKDFTYWFVKGDSGFVLDSEKEENPKPNVLGKIPIVYYRQEAPEWADSQTLCDRQETLLSNFSDTNDYFASPMVVLEGEVKGFADKGETGKIVTVSGGGKINYLTWDAAPEAIKFEFENNDDLIFTGLQLPNISFSKMKSIGYNNNAVIKLLFSDPHMKAETKWELFGIGVQRRLNIISRMVAMLEDLEDEYKKVAIVPVMEPYLPENISETVGALVVATGGGKVMSQKRGVELNPMVENIDQEIDRIQKEDKENQLIGAESFE
jgi:SPP1 family phage portal protein